METRKYPLTDELKELTADALAELALRYEIEASGLGALNSQEAHLRGAELMEQAEALRQASDYYLNL